jgi:hypothetical protein
MSMDDRIHSTPDSAEVGGTGITRRRALTVGGFSVAVAAVLAACGKDKPAAQVPQAGLAPTTTGLPTQVITDPVLLRTASSLEHSLIAAYDTLIKAGNVDANVAEMLKLFQQEHQQHAQYFEKATMDAGAPSVTTPNSAFQANVVEPGLALVSKGGNQGSDIISFSYQLEAVAAGTFQLFVPIFTLPALRSDVMSVGGVEARHAAMMAKFVPNSKVAPPPPGAPTPPTTTTSVKAVGPTTTAPATAPPAYQVPGPFGPLTAVQVVLDGTTVSADLLGPNSYEYITS